ncbi:MAG: succinate dehydrogenase assembly factor 2 [Hellea sp.]|nr:succinate dehydrogenase assembly factor 2 [Hellea sp.]
MNKDDKKRLIYRANYRGFKEADIMLGGFLKANIDTLSDAELDAFEILLSAKDHDIYDWITEKQPVPKQYDEELLAKIRQFRPKF